jgi:lipoate-protein ligase A
MLVTEVATLHLVRESFPDRPAFGAAVSRAILERVAARELPDTARLGRPGRIVAFGKQDVASLGYREAVVAARGAGFAAIQRLAGGRAAVYTEGTLSLSHACADRHPTQRTRSRFEEMAGMLRDALSSLGADARVGEVPGEYCPGAFSVNAGGRTKLVGIGQRVIVGGAHVGAVVVVSGSDAIRDVLIPVYRALGLSWDPETVGSVVDEVPGVGLAEVEEAILRELARRNELVEASLDPATLALAEAREARHEAPAMIDR